MQLSDFDPRRQSPKMQKLMGGILLAAFFLCLLLNMGSTLPELIFRDMPVHLGAGALVCLILMAWNSLISKGSHGNSASKLAALYDLHGYCPEMADILKNIRPEPTDRDKVLRAYILSVCGDTAQAAEQFSDIPAKTLPQRELAMLVTAKIRHHFRIGDFGKVRHLFETHRSALDFAYDAQPDFDGAFSPYADDTLEYFMLAAVYSELCRQPERAAQYREKAAQRAAQRPAAEAGVLTRLTVLQEQYAAGVSESARETETALAAELSALNASSGTVRYLRRLVQGASDFFPARLGICDSVFRERRLPQ